MKVFKQTNRRGINGKKMSGKLTRKKKRLEDKLKLLKPFRLFYFSSEDFSYNKQFEDLHVCFREKKKDVLKSKNEKPSVFE